MKKILSALLFFLLIGFSSSTLACEDNAQPTQKSGAETQASHPTNQKVKKARKAQSANQSLSDSDSITVYSR